MLYGDAFSLYRQPPRGPALAPAGRALPAALSCRRNTSYRYAGAINVASGQLTWRGRSKMGVPTLRRFLARVRAAYPGPPIHLIWDNRPGHAHPEVLARAADLEIEVLWLPPYAPWPTPIEKLWRWLTQDLLRHHRLADQFRALQARVAARLDQFARPSPALPRHVGLTCWPG